MRSSVPSTRPPGDNWRLWGTRAYMYPEVQVWKLGATELKTVKPKELPPYYNVAGLYWRPSVSQTQHS